MALSPEDRGMLEKIIDLQIQNIPKNVAFTRDEKVKKGLMINNDYDFVMGQVFSSIISAFSSYYMDKLKTSLILPTPQQFQDSLQEAVDVIIRRIAEVRKAIFDCG